MHPPFLQEILNLGIITCPNKSEIFINKSKKVLGKLQVGETSVVSRMENLHHSLGLRVHPPEKSDRLPRSTSFREGTLPKTNNNSLHLVGGRNPKRNASSSGAPVMLGAKMLVSGRV